MDECILSESLWYIIHIFSYWQYKNWKQAKNQDRFLKWMIQIHLIFARIRTRTPTFWGYPHPPPPQTNPTPHPHPPTPHPTPPHPRLMITHIIESYWIPSQKTKSKLQIWRICQNFKFLNQTLYVTHLLKLLHKMCKYEMDPTSIVEDTERTRFCPQTDRQTDRRTDRRTDGQTDKLKPVYPPLYTSLKQGVKLAV